MTEVNKAKSILLFASCFLFLMSGLTLWRAFQGIVFKRIPAETGRYNSNPEILGQDAVLQGTHDLLKVVVGVTLALLCLVWIKKMDEF